MNERKGYRPNLLALGITIALGTGSLVPVRSEASDPWAYSSSWECFANLHQDWLCSPGPGQPYAEQLEQISVKRDALQGTFASLHDDKTPEKTELSAQSAPHYDDYANNNDDNGYNDDYANNNDANGYNDDYANNNDDNGYNDDYANNNDANGYYDDNGYNDDYANDYNDDYNDDYANNNDDNGYYNDDNGYYNDNDYNDTNATPNEQAETRARERAETTDSQKPPFRSLSKQNWVARLGRKSAWPEDLSQLPEREPARQPTPAIAQVTEEDISRSVLLSDWLEKARQRSSLGDGKGTNNRMVTVQSDRKKESTDEGSDRAYTDNWLDKANQKTAWVDPTPEPTHEDNADSPELELVSSITMPEGASRTKRNAPITPAERAQEITLPAPARPKGFRANLLAHQAATDATTPQGVVAPQSVQSVQRNMPAFQMELGHAQMAEAYAYAPPLTEQPKLVQQQSPYLLPDLEVTPDERLAKAYPPPASGQRFIPQQQQMTTPEQWQSAVADTRMPDTRYANHQTNPTYVTPDQILLPSRVPNRVPNRGQPEHSPDHVRGWSLSGEVVSGPVPSVKNPVSDPLLTASPEMPHWPEPQYTANNRMAPALPSATGETARLTNKNNTGSFRIPPPVSLENIYELAAQEPIPANPETEQQNAPFDRSSRTQPKGTSSADRFLKRIREPAASFEAPKAHRKQIPSQPIRFSAEGLQQVRMNPTSGHQHQASLQEMLGAPERSVSIQWASSMEPAVISRLQERYPVLRNATVALFSSKNKNWYLLLGGIYPNTEAALKTLRSNEYQTIKHLNPWPRSLSTLKQLNHIADATQTQGAAHTPKPAALPQGQYTIQWLESDSHEILQDLKSRYPQLANAEVVMVSRNKELRYHLIQGRYKEYKAVQEALLAPRFSTLAQQLVPKPRPMASLRHNVDIALPVDSSDLPTARPVITRSSGQKPPDEGGSI